MTFHTSVQSTIHDPAASSGVSEEWGSYPPHPNPLPKWAREITEACSCPSLTKQAREITEACSWLPHPEPEGDCGAMQLPASPQHETRGIPDHLPEREWEAEGDRALPLP